jgi:phthiocerol/phenolphthiocerol synthesis type-I polyketide synthase C
MEPDELLAFLARGIAEVTGRPAPTLNPEADIAALGLDSLQTLELVAWAEERLGVRVPDEELTTLRTVAELSSALAARIPGGTR